MASTTVTTGALVQRLVDERLTAPGMLDRRTLQRTYERFSHPTESHVLNRLHRRIVSAGSGTESLPLVRIDRSAQREVSSPARAGGALLTSVAEAASDRAVGRSADLNAGNSFVAPVTAATVAAGIHGATTELASTGPSVGTAVTRTPRIGSSSKLVARSAAVARPGGASEPLSRHDARASERPAGDQPTIVNRVASGIVQRTAVPGASVSTVGEPTSAAASTVATMAANVTRMATDGVPALPVAQVVMRKREWQVQVPDIATAGTLRRAPLDGTMRSPTPSSSRAQPSPSAPPSPGAPRATAASLSPDGAPPAGPSLFSGVTLPVARPSLSGGPLLSRMPDVVARMPASNGSLPIAVSPGVTVRSGELLLRKPDVVVPAQSPPPSVTGSETDGGVPPMVAQAAAVPSAQGEQVRTSVDHLNMDWIAEQVGDRLTRRLEIERERLGVRPWRQVS